MLPVMFETRSGVIELASFRKFSETHLSFLDSSRRASASCQHDRVQQRTEDLLQQSHP